MKLFFIEFGTYDASRFRQAAEALSLGPVDVSSQIGAQAGYDSPVTGGLSDGLKLLFQEQTICVRVHPQQSEVKWVLLFAPNAMDSTIPMWHGMLELRSISHDEMFSILKRAGLQYVAVARDEPFDLKESTLNPDHFPWTSPSFVAAALADDKGSYIEHSPPFRV